MNEAVFKHPIELILQFSTYSVYHTLKCNVYFLSYKLEEACNYNWKFAMEMHLKTFGVVLNEIITDTKMDMTETANIHLKVKHIADAHVQASQRNMGKYKEGL